MTENSFYKQNQFKRKTVIDSKPKGPTALQISLDAFIQNSLNSYVFSEISPKMVESASVFNKILFNFKSLIPDLVIYNKTFNKNQCFLEGISSNFSPFPRSKFILKKRFQQIKLSNDNINENVNEEKELEENHEECNNKNNEEIQWEDIDASELKETVNFQSLPKKILDLKIENSNIDFLANNDVDDIHHSLEKNLESLFENNSRKESDLYNKTLDKEVILDNSINNYEEKNLEIPIENDKKDKFSLFSDLSLFNRNTDSSNQVSNANININSELNKEKKNDLPSDYIIQNYVDNSKIFENVCYLENPIALIKKNLLAKNWFVTKNDKLINCFTSFELFKFFENYINKKKDITSYWIYDNETDIHFTASSIYENLKEHIVELMKEMQNNIQQSIIKNQMIMNNFPPNMMFSPRNQTQGDSKLPIIQQHVPIFQPFGPMQINNRFMPPQPLFMPMPKNYAMMNIGMNNIQKDKKGNDYQTMSNCVPLKPEIISNTSKNGK